MKILTMQFQILITIVKDTLDQIRIFLINKTRTSILHISIEHLKIYYLRKC